MTNIRAKVTPTSGTALKARVNPANEFVVTNYALNASNLKLANISDINMTDIADGAALIYNDDTSTWEASPIIENPNTTLNGGNF